MDFIEALKKARAGYPSRRRWRVVIAVHQIAYVTDGGSTFGIDIDGNIGGLCRNKEDTLTGHDLLELAIKAGGRKLQAFGFELFEFYTKNNFRPISWIQFNPRKAPPGWKESYGKDPLIFYALDRTYNPKTKELFFLFMSSTKPSKDETEAYFARDEWQYATQKKKKKQRKNNKIKRLKERKEGKDGIN